MNFLLLRNKMREHEHAAGKRRFGHGYGRPKELVNMQIGGKYVFRQSKQP